MKPISEVTSRGASEAVQSEAAAADEDPRIRFKDGTYGATFFADEQDRLILVGGAITTPGRFARFDDSLCHLKPDGVIVRYGREIGARDDLIFLDAAAAHATDASPAPDEAPTE